MAFNKRTWKGRQGVGLNKFSINGASPVTVVNQPDSITEVGDALSAGNLNDLEDRIESAFTDEATEREADITDVKNAIQATNARVENLEQEHGSYHDVDVKSVYTIPSGKAKNWSVNVLRGVMRARNQLFSDVVDSSSSVYGITRTRVSAGKLRYQGTATTSTSFTCANLSASDYISGHSYLVGLGNVVLPSGCHISTSNTDKATASVDTFADKSLGVFITSGTTVDFTVEPICTDLNVCFCTSDLSFLGATNAEKLATIQTYYHWLLVPSAYGNSLVNTTYEGVKTIGVNIWDEEWDNGYWNIANGQFVPESRFLGCKNLIKVTQGETYYFKFPVVMEMCGFDANGNFVQSLSSSIANTSLQIPMGVSFIAFSSKSASALTTYNNDIQICLNSYADKTTYHPHMTDTLSLPTPITLRSAGTVAEEFDLESGVKTNPLYDYTFTGSETWVQWNAKCYYANCIMKVCKDSYNIINCNASFALPTTSDDLYYNGDTVGRAIACRSYAIYLSVDMYNNRSELVGKTVTYALATPDAPTQLDPIQNPYLPTEAGGTISSILTDAVDDSMTLGYINL